MFTELLRLLDWREAAVPCKESFVLVKDTVETDADFLLITFVTVALKAGGRLSLVCARNRFQHYFLIARKLVRVFHVRLR
jgi:hypothetical protein